MSASAIRRRARAILLALGFALLTAAGPAAAAPATLDYFLTRADSSHPQLELARARVETARVAVEAVRADWYPALTLKPEAQISSARYNSTTSVTRDRSWLAADLSQLVCDFGRTSARARAAILAVTAAEAELATARRAVFQTVTDRYYSALQADRLAGLRQRTFADRGTLQAKISILVDSGVRPRADLMRAVIDAENARLELAAATARVGIAREQLGGDAGLGRAWTGELEDSLDRIPEPPPDTDLVTLALQARPELVAARLTSAARRADWEAARKQYYPALNASASYEAGDRDYRVTSDGATDRVPYRSFEDWSVGLALGWSNLNFAAVRAEIAAAEAAYREAEARRFEAERAVAVEVAVALTGLLESRQRVRVAEAVVAAAAENHRLTLRRYESGVTTVLDVTDSQVKLTEAEVAALQARADVWQNDATLRYAAGLAVGALDP